MTDPAAALVEALAEYKAGIVGTFSIPPWAAPRWEDRSPEDRESWIEGAREDAADILAKLPSGWCGHDPFHRERCHNYDPDSVIAHLHAEYDKAAAVIARLRPIEEAARAYRKALTTHNRRFHQDNCPERGDFERWYADKARSWERVEALRDALYANLDALGAE